MHDNVLNACSCGATKTTIIGERQRKGEKDFRKWVVSVFEDEEHDEEVTCVFVSPVLVFSVFKLKEKRAQVLRTRRSCGLELVSSALESVSFQSN